MDENDDVVIIYNNVFQYICVEFDNHL